MTNPTLTPELTNSYFATFTTEEHAEYQSWLAERDYIAEFDLADHEPIRLGRHLADNTVYVYENDDLVF
jgi:hypothetical protein